MSMMQQTFTDWVCIAVNDACNDRSQKVLHAFGDARFKIIANPSHYGLTRSLNIALNYAPKCEFIARHDSDDFSEPTRLERQIQFLENRPEISVVGTYAKLWTPSLKLYGSQSGTEGPESIASRLTKNNPIVHGSVLMRAKTILKFRYNEEYRVCQDYDLWCRMVKDGVKICNIPEFLYNRVSHKESVTKNSGVDRYAIFKSIRRFHWKHVQS